MDTNTQGAIAEAVIAARATFLGVIVAKPLFKDERYDLIFDAAGRLLRIQCKSVSLRRNVVEVRARTCRRTAGGYVRGTYSAEEIDAVAAYCRQTDLCYLVPVSEIPPSGWLALRTAPAKNNQQKGLHSAADYELTYGAIAQLGEHLHGMQGVAGSSPASSTSQEPRIARLFA
jgi:hypothetical protein